MTKSNPLARVGLVHYTEMRYFALDLARALKERHGSEVHLYTGTSQDKSFYLNAAEPGLLDSVTENAVGYTHTRAVDLDPVAVIARARTNEARVNRTFNMLAVADRHLGRGYALGGFHHSRSRYSEDTSYIQFLHYFNEAVAFWEREIQGRGLDILLMAPKEAIAVAESLRVPTRMLLGARHKNYYLWGHGYHFENPAVEPAWRSLAGRTFAPVTLDAPYDRDQAHRARFRRNRGFRPLIRSLAQTTAYRLWHRLRGYEKGRGYRLRDLLGEIYLNWSEARRLIATPGVSLDTLAKTPFVFYPLQEEPEVAVGQLSHEYFFQLETIARISRDLPAGWMLAVKETIHAIGRRPREFYDQIREFKNVAFLDLMELGVRVAARARAVVTLTSSVGFEAAVMGTPVIAFGRHNHYNFLPHVVAIRDPDELAPALARVVAGGIDLQRAAEDGARFLAAVVETSFEMTGFQPLDPRRYAPAAVENALAALEASVGLRVSKSAAQA